MDNENANDILDSKKYLTTEECARFIGRTPGAIRNLVMRRAIPFRKPSGRLLFVRTEIENWICESPGVSLKDLRGAGTVLE